jgi:hypothetical protein
MSERVVTIVANGSYIPNKDGFPCILPKFNADGKGIASFFSKHKFKILNKETMNNQDRIAMETHAEKHVEHIKNHSPEVAAYYFSGHGLQDNEELLLMPVDYEPPPSKMTEKNIAKENRIKCFRAQVISHRRVDFEC